MTHTNGNVEDGCSFHSCVLQKPGCLFVVVEARSECYLFTDRRIAERRFEDMTEMFHRVMEDYFQKVQAHKKNSDLKLLHRGCE